MGRERRLELAGGFYHVTSRGNDKRTIYRDARDGERFLAILVRVAIRYGWIVYAHCLMTNHYHLVLQIPHGGLSAGMRLLNGGYSRVANRRHGSTGHLLQNRFFAGLLQDDAHLLETCRYVVLNPVRAGLCKGPEEWRWSSYRACAGLELPPAFLAVGELLRLFARRPGAAIRAYRDFVSAGHVLVSDTVTEL
jgi:putative transposase